MGQPSLERRQQAMVLVVNDSDVTRNRWINRLKKTGVEHISAPAKFTALCELLTGTIPSFDLIILDYQFGDWGVDFKTIHGEIAKSSLTHNAKTVVLTAYRPVAKRDPVIAKCGYKVLNDQSSSVETFEGIIQEFIG